jgi:hypothetical protein
MVAKGGTPDETVMHAACSMLLEVEDGAAVNMHCQTISTFREACLIVSTTFLYLYRTLCCCGMYLSLCCRLRTRPLIHPLIVSCMPLHAAALQCLSTRQLLAAVYRFSFMQRNIWLHKSQLATHSTAHTHKNCSQGAGMQYACAHRWCCWRGIFN